MAKKSYFRFPAWCTTPSDDFSACAACNGNDDCELQTCYQILEASKGFFYTYELLLKDSKYPFFERSQEKAAERIAEGAAKLGQPTLFYSIVVNGSMATELALKYLTYRDTHEFVQTHRLDLLFKDLPPKDREEILLRIRKQTGASDEVFERSLDTFASAFNEARYFFSLGNKGVSLFFDDFTRVVHEYAIETFHRELPS